MERRGVLENPKEEEAAKQLVNSVNRKELRELWGEANSREAKWEVAWILIGSLCFLAVVAPFMDSKVFMHQWFWEGECAILVLAGLSTWRTLRAFRDVRVSERALGLLPKRSLEELIYQIHEGTA